MTRVGIYVRVSTQEQADEGYSIGEQQERLTSYCNAKDWTIYETYIDPAFSGSNLERPNMNRMIRDVEKHNIDLVLVYKLDRLSRSQKDTLFLIEDVFIKNGVAFVSVNENFDTTTAFGRAMIGILSVFAQLEREQINERTSMGRIARAKDGLFHGGGFDPIGYDYVDGHLIVNENEAVQIKKIYELFLSGWTFNAIQKYMNERYTNKYSSWNNRTRVRDVLRRESLTGVIVFDGVRYEGQHDAIIDVDTFKLAQDRYRTIKWRSEDHASQPYKANYLLTGLLICHNCGARYYIKGNTFKGEGYVPLYTCYSRGKTNKKLIVDPHCRNKIYRATELDQIIISEILKLQFDPSLIDKITKSNTRATNTKELLKSLEARLMELNRQSDRLIDLYQVGSIDQTKLTARITELGVEMEKVNILIDEQRDSHQKMDKDQVVNLLGNAKNILYGEDMMVKRAFVQSLINSITVDKDDLTIQWAFE